MTPADETLDEATVTEENTESGETGGAHAGDEIDDDHTPETEAGSEDTGETGAAADDHVPDAPEGTDWEKHGPVLWNLLHRVLGSPKQKQDDHYSVKIDDKTIGDAHNALAAIQ